MRTPGLAALLVLSFAGCTQPSSAPAASPTAGANPVATALQTSSFQAAGPQSYTPETWARGRSRAVRQLWSTPIGATDHRSTLAFVDGAIYVGTKSGKAGEAGVYVIDGSTGARRALLPAARGDVVGIAIEGDRVVSTSASGEVAATTKAGQILFRTNIGAPVVTPPTLVDADRDGSPEIAVGDATGRISLLDGKTGKVRWTKSTKTKADAGAAVRSAIGSGLAAADLDGDGEQEIVAGTEAGQLLALRARTGDIAWTVSRSSALRAAPLVADVDADKQLEVIAGWADGEVSIFDGRAGKQIWTARVEEDDGDPTGLLASPTPIPGGSLLVPTARWGKEDSVVLLRANERAYRSKQGSVVTSPVLGAIESGTTFVEAIVGTTLGDVVAFDAAGGMSFLYHVDGAIEAPLLIADIASNGLQQLVVATRDGKLTALAIDTPRPPVLGRARGNSLRNDGVLPPIDLGWRLP
jgi:outer membrane protein assembly factor BamB